MALLNVVCDARGSRHVGLRVRPRRIAAVNVRQCSLLCRLPRLARTVLLNASLCRRLPHTARHSLAHNARIHTDRTPAYGPIWSELGNSRPLWACKAILIDVQTFHTDHAYACIHEYYFGTLHQGQGSQQRAQVRNSAPSTCLAAAIWLTSCGILRCDAAC